MVERLVLDLIHYLPIRTNEEIMEENLNARGLMLNKKEAESKKDGEDVNNMQAALPQSEDRPRHEVTTMAVVLFNEDTANNFRRLNPRLYFRSTAMALVAKVKLEFLKEFPNLSRESGLITPFSAASRDPSAVVRKMGITRVRSLRGAGKGMGVDEGE